jgi:hypothetical protein
LEAAGECGTHSILDIERIGKRPGFAVATQLPSQELQRTFGTLEPTHEMVEAHWPDIAEELGSWQAFYFTVFKQVIPVEYAFIGCSGD